MKKPIVIKEYEELTSKEQYSSSKIRYEEELKDCDFGKLQQYLKCQNLDSALTITHNGIKANSYVGVIKFKNTQIQILPKLISENQDDNGQILNNLVYMLSYTKNLDIKINDNSNLSNKKNPFIEVLIREYSKSLFECLKRLTPKKYVREEDNLNYLKGKIKFAENIRYNCTNQAKFYCEFDEFSENNILNQLFLFVSTCLYNISSDSTNKKTLKFIINYYSDIKFVRFDKFKAEKIKLSKNQELFKKPFNLAKMFIEKTSVDLSKNKFENITLVWDMNKLFEEFIFEFIKKNFPNCKAYSQKDHRLLRKEKNNQTYRDTKVDILLEKPDKIIIDTKYKKFTTFDDIKSADIYQVTTYCLLHDYKRAILLYPQFEEQKHESDYCINNPKNDYNIEFYTVNLKYNNLKDEQTKQKIIAELKEILMIK